MKTYVQAETAPLHAGIAQLSTDFQMVAMDAVDHDERIDKLETNITELQKRVDSHSKLSNLQLGAPQGLLSTRTTRIIAAFHLRASLPKVWIPDATLSSNL